MIVITQAEVRTECGEHVELVLNARWLSGARFQYRISRHGICVEGFGRWVPKCSRRAVHHFVLISHGEVWTLLVRLRFARLRRSWYEVARWLHGSRPMPLADDEIGTAFGTLSAGCISQTLRALGYEVEERLWSDMVQELVHPVLAG
jgi:hypothetical protein